jgi:dTDP-4-amino-4,6-dideoxygalactose transaminase
MRVPFLDLNRQFDTIRDEINEEIQCVLQNSSFILGPQVTTFEEEFAKLHTTKYCCGVNSGTSALHVTLKALEIKPGDEVIVPALTFVATAWAASYCGAKPVFCDVLKSTATMNPQSLEHKITDRTRAVIAVHLYGQACEMKEISDICKKHDLLLVEDCAQAHCAEYRGRRVSTFGVAGCFSFYPGKNLGAYGESGAVLTNDENLARKIRKLRDHGQSKLYNHDCIGFNYRMDGIQGAVLNVKLKYIERWTEQRRVLAQKYHKALKGVVLPGEESDRRHVYHLFVVRHPKRELLAQELSLKGIASGLHYPKPVHLQGAYADLGGKRGDLPISEAWADECLSLPLFPELMDNEIDYVAKNINGLTGLG